MAGTAFGGLGGAPLVALFVSAVAAGTFLIRNRAYRLIVSLAAALFFLGALHYAVDDYRYHAKVVALRNETQFEGTIVRVPRERDQGQSVLVKLADGRGRVMLYTEGHSNLTYGDLVRFSGEIVPPPADSFGLFLAKEHIVGSVFRPELEVVGKGGAFFMRPLIAFRNRIEEVIRQAFPHGQAAFLAGVLLGDRDAFSQDFLDKLSLSGTMHLVALSGQHMTLIVFAVSILFGFMFRGRTRYAFIASFITVTAFTAMTGFVVSAVRAALMSFLVSFAKESGRLYSPRNALAFSALVIALWNPKTIVFDLGFQLSFAATASILFLAPVVLRIPFFAKPGFCGWRIILAVTIAAQAGVLPLTIANFANFSLTSLLANVAILVVTPATMILGYLWAFLAIVIPPLGPLTAAPLSFLAAYSIGVIETGAAFATPFNPDIGLTGAIAYYATLAWVCWRWR